MVRVGDTYVRSGACGDVGDYIVVDFAVVRVKPKIYGDIGVQGFKIGYCLFIDFGLGFVCVVFGPESDRSWFPEPASHSLLRSMAYYK